MSKYSLSSFISSKRIKNCYTILHENPPPYETENCVTPFPCSLPRPTHIKLAALFAMDHLACWQLEYLLTHFIVHNIITFNCYIQSEMFIIIFNPSLNILIFKYSNCVKITKLWLFFWASMIFTLCKVMMYKLSFYTMNVTFCGWDLQL